MQNSHSDIILFWKYSIIMLALSALFLAAISYALGGEPEVPCPAPRSPENGQAFPQLDGRTVKFSCESGYILAGREVLRCIDGQWNDEFPICVDPLGSSPQSALVPPPRNLSPHRPLFNWNDETDEDDDKADTENDDAVQEADTDDETDEDKPTTPNEEDVALGDEAVRVRTVFYPRRRVFTRRIVRPAAELEEEERRRKEDVSSATIHVQSPHPSVLYVRRTMTPGKSSSQEETLRRNYRVAQLNTERVEVVQLPRQAASQSDKGEDALRQAYWVANYNYLYPRQASLYDYRVPTVLTESQINWINSLHPELRDRYLRDLHIIRADEAAEPARSQAFLRRYEYHVPATVQVVTTDPVASYDYSCNQAGSPFVTAPRMHHAHIARYDRRQNPRDPHNHYLTVIYRCDPGYTLLDSRHDQLHCSNRAWVGVEPVCLRTG